MDNHGHGGRTQLVWLRSTPADSGYDTASVRAAWQRYACADRDQYAHLPAAVEAAGMLPGLCDAYEGLAVAYAAAHAELARLRAEHAAQQEALDVIAAVTEPAGGSTQ